MPNRKRHWLWVSLLLILGWTGLYAQTIPLDRGWSLIGSAVDIPAEEFNRSIVQKVDIVWAYRDNKWYAASADAKRAEAIKNEGYNMLTDIKAGEGFWVFTPQSGKNLSFTGLPSKEMTLVLQKGWQLLSPKIKEGIALKDLNRSSVGIVWTYKLGQWSAWSPDKERSKALAAIYPTIEKIWMGQGFWIYGKSGDEFEFGVPPTLPKVSVAGEVIGVAQRTAAANEAMGTASLIIDSNGDGIYNPDQGDKVLHTSIKNRSFSFTDIELPAGVKSMDVVVKIEIDGYAPVEKRLTLKVGSTPALQVDMSASKLVKTTQKLNKRESQRRGHYITFVVHKGANGKRYMTSLRTTKADQLTFDNDTDFAASYDMSLFDENVTAVTFTAQKFDSVNSKEMQFFPGNFEAVVPRRALQRMGRRVLTNVGDEKVKLESVAFSYTKLEDQNGQEITFKNMPDERRAEDINFSDCRIIFWFRLNKKQRNIVEEKGDYDTNTSAFEVPIWGYRWSTRLWEYVGMGDYNKTTGDVKVCVTNPRIKNYHNIDYFSRLVGGKKPKALCIHAEDQWNNPVANVYVHGKEIGIGNDIIADTTNYKGRGLITIPDDRAINDYNITYSRWGWGIENVPVNPEDIVSGGEEGCDYTLDLKVENPFSHTVVVHSYDINGSARVNKWVYIQNQEGLWFWQNKMTDENGTVTFQVAADTKYKITDQTASGFIKIDNNPLQSDGFTETFDNGEMVEANLTQVERKPRAGGWLYGYYQIPEQVRSIKFYLYGYDDNGDDINLSSLKIDGRPLQIKPDYEKHNAGYYYGRFTYTLASNGLELGDHNITAVLMDEKGNAAEPVVIRFQIIKNRAPRIYGVTINDAKNNYVNPQTLRADKLYKIQVWAYDPDGDDYTLRYKFGPNEQDGNETNFMFYEDGDYNITVYATDKPDNNVTPETSEYHLRVHVGNNKPVISYVTIPTRVVKGLPFKFQVTAYDIDSDELNVSISDGVTEKSLNQEYRYYWYKSGGIYKGEMNLTNIGDLNVTIKAVDNEGGVTDVNRSINVIPSKIYFVRTLPATQNVDIKRRSRRSYYVYAGHYDGWYAARNIKYEWTLDGKKLDSTSNYVTVDYRAYKPGDTPTLACRIYTENPKAGENPATTSCIVTITSSNKAPRIAPIGNVTLKQGFGSYSMLIKAWDPDGDKLTYSAHTSEDANFTVTVAGRELTIKEMKGKWGEGDVTVKVSDDENSTMSTFHVTVKKVDHAPVIKPIADVSFDENETNKTVVVDAVDPDEDPLVYEVTWDNPNLIDINVTGNQLKIFRKDRKVFGRSLVTVRVRDPYKKVSKRVFAVYLPDINPPLVKGIEELDLFEGFSKTDLNITVDGKSGEELNGYAVLSVRKSFDAPFNIELKNNHVYLKGIPYRNGVGTVWVTAYKLSNKMTATKRIVVNVKNVDNSPVFYTPEDGQVYKVYEDFGTTWITLKAIDPDGANIPVTYRLVEMKGDALDKNQSGIEENMLKLVSLPNAYGTVEIKVEASSKNPDSNVSQSKFVTFKVEVIAVDDAPTMPDFKPLILDEDFGTKVIELRAVDVDGDPISYSYKIQENNSGISVRISDNRLELTSSADQFGTASIVVTAMSNGKSVSKTLNVTVRPVNDAPFIAPIDKQTFYYQDSLIVPVKVSDVDHDRVSVTVATCNALSAQYDETNSSILIQVAQPVETSGSCDVNVTASDGKLSTSRIFTVTWFNDTSALMTFETPMEGLIVSLHDVKTLESLTSGKTDENGTVALKIQKRNRVSVMISAIPDTIADNMVLFGYWYEKIMSARGYSNGSVEYDSGARTQDRANESPDFDAYMLPVKRIEAVLPSDYQGKASDFDENNDTYLNVSELKKLSLDLFDKNPKDKKVSLGELYGLKGAHVVMLEDIPLGTYKVGLNDILSSLVDYGDIDELDRYAHYLYAPDGHKEVNVTITDLDDTDHVWLRWSGSAFGGGYYEVENNETTFTIDLTRLGDDGRYKVLFEKSVDMGGQWMLETINPNQTKITISAKNFENSRVMGVDQAGYYGVKVDLDGVMDGLNFNVQDWHDYYANDDMHYYLTVDADTKPYDSKNGLSSDKGVDNRAWSLNDIPLELKVDDLGLLKVETILENKPYRLPAVEVKGEDVAKVDMVGLQWRTKTKLENESGFYALSFSVYDTNGSKHLASRKMMNHLVDSVREPAKAAYYAMKYIQTGMKRGWSINEAESFAIDLVGSETQEEFFEALPKIAKDRLELLWVGTERENDRFSSTTKTLGIFEELQDVAVDVNETATMHIVAVTTKKDANVTYRWKVNGIVQSTEGATLSYTPTKVDDYVVTCEVSDGDETLTSTAHIRVKDSVVGQVQVDEDGTVAEGAVVRLYSKWDNGRMYDQTVKSDANGNYSFKDVPAGDYYLVIAADGYEPKTIVLHVNTKE